MQYVSANNNNILYVHRESNHPPSILKNIPQSINRRLSKISSNQTVFTKAAPQYQEALKASGYEHKLEFKSTDNSAQQNTTQNRKRQRKLPVTWFNPPFSDTVATNVGKQFFRLLDKCFPEGHKLRKILNRKTVKLSDSCMPNMQQIISSHNKALLKSTNNADPEPARTCNCNNQTTCPLEGNCLASSLVYQATVTVQGKKEETYIGLTAGTFKTRYNNHKSDFRLKRNSTELSKYVWSLQDKGTQYSITWKIMTKAMPYSTSSKRCNLCLAEKYLIMCKPEISSLNNRNELASTCRHRRNHLLENYT